VAIDILYFDLATRLGGRAGGLRRKIALLSEKWCDVLVRLLTEASEGLPPARARILT